MLLHWEVKCGENKRRGGERREGGERERQGTSESFEHNFNGMMRMMRGDVISGLALNRYSIVLW